MAVSAINLCASYDVCNLDTLVSGCAKSQSLCKHWKAQRGVANVDSPGRHWLQKLG